MELQNLDNATLIAIRVAKALAEEYKNATYSSGHLLLSLLNKEVGIRNFIATLGTDMKYLEEWAEVRVEDYPKGSATEINGDEKILRIFEEADAVRLKLGLLKINPICILCALARPGAGFTLEQLKTFPIREKDILESLLQKSEIQRSIGHPASESDSIPVNNMLIKYCIDKTLLAKEQKIFPIVRRDKEMRMVMEILSRQNKPNVIITGEAGVGKTALIDGLACEIITGTVPSCLKEATIFELDMGELVSGATYKGEVEERLKNIIKELRQQTKAILFIDDIHLLLDIRSGNTGASNILKQELSKGELTVIGATTIDEYRKLIEPDHAFNRRFEEISLAEPDLESAIIIMNAIYIRSSEFHQVQATEEALASCVYMAKRYIKERRLPDAAIDLLDRTMASVKMINQTAVGTVNELQRQLDGIQTKQDAPNEQIKELSELYFTIRNRLSPILLSLISEEDNNLDDIDPVLIRTLIKKELDTIADFLQSPITIITDQEVAAVIAAKTKIPVGKIRTGEKEKLMRMEDLLRLRVVGQDHALKVLSDAILESRSGMNKPGQPIGSFFLLGPTGTGKTELAKALAEVLFDDEKAMIRYDMSEFKEEHSVALLYGAPPGYIGYEEGGLLVNKIRRQPYTVVLFDEIEKAHPSVYDIFLQIMDEGKLHDRLGKEGDFSNAIVLFTSNVGSEWLSTQIKMGQQPSMHQLMEMMGKYFRPEFLARLSEIVPFSPIDENILLQIFNIQLIGLKKLMEKQGLKIELTESAKSVLANKDFVPQYGARQIAGTIRSQLRRPISRLIITGKVGNGSTINISTDEQGNLVWNY